jgi:FKBP-type peptidyl-prolyl cis-trans isomerase FklB
MKGATMRLFLTVVLIVGLIEGFVFAEEKIVLEEEKDKLSYSMGLKIGKNFKKESIDVDPDIFTKGLKDGLSGNQSLMTEQQVKEAITSFQQEMLAKKAEQMKILAEKNKKEGERFLAENKKKEGVITLPSGLQYKVIKEGAGDVPKKTDTVTTNYRGTLINGTEFDSSYKRGQPATFPVNGVIPGWTEALQLMKEGASGSCLSLHSLHMGSEVQVMPSDLMLH